MATVTFSQVQCRYILSEKLKSDDFTLLNIQQSTFEEKNGYLGEHSSLRITIDRNDCEETHHFFVKTLPTVPSQRNYALEINGFFKESHFFTKYLQLLKAHSIDILDDAIPQCFLVDEESFVFDDLTVKGYTTLPSRRPLELKCVKAALTTLAKLHASCIILEERKQFRLIDEFEEEVAETFYSEKESVEKAFNSAKHGLRAVVDLTHTEEMKIPKDVFLKKFVDCADQQKDFARPSTKFRNTICHADVWTKNFMFKFEESKVDCVVVDFQTYRYGPPAQDVMTFLHLTTDKKLREEHFEELLRFYYEELVSNFGKFGYTDLVSEEELLDSCRYYKQFALMQTLTHFQVILMTDEVLSEVLKPEVADYVMFDSKYDFVAKTCKIDPVYRKMNFEAMEEFRLFLEDRVA